MGRLKDAWDNKPELGGCDFYLTFKYRIFFLYRILSKFYKLSTDDCRKTF